MLITTTMNDDELGNDKIQNDDNDDRRPVNRTSYRTRMLLLLVLVLVPFLLLRWLACYLVDVINNNSFCEEQINNRKVLSSSF